MSSTVEQYVTPTVSALGCTQQSALQQLVSKQLRPMPSAIDGPARSQCSCNSLLSLPTDYCSSNFSFEASDAIWSALFCSRLALRFSLLASNVAVYCTYAAGSALYASQERCRIILSVIRFNFASILRCAASLASQACCQRSSLMASFFCHMRR